MIALALAALLAATAAPAGEALATVEDVGRAPFASAADAPAAREQATAAAVRGCIAQVAGALATAPTAPDQAQLLADRILSRPSGYLRRLQVLEDRQDGASWQIRARCDVAAGQLEDDLLAAGIAHRRAGLPRVMLRVVEAPLPGAEGGTAIGALAAACAERLARSGFEVVGRDSPAAGEAGTAGAAAAGAQVVVTGRAAPRLGAALPVAGAAGLQQATVAVSARVVRADTGQALGTIELTGPVGRGFEPAEAVREAQAEAGRALAGAVLTQVGRAWPAASSGPSQVALVVRGAGDYARLAAFKGAVRGVPGVREVQDRSFDSTAAQLLVTVNGTPESFATDLATRRLVGFSVRVGAVRPGAVEVELR